MNCCCSCHCRRKPPGEKCASRCPRCGKCLCYCPCGGKNPKPSVPPACIPDLAGVVAQMSRPSKLVLEAGEAVKFDQILNGTEEDMAYESEEGAFLLKNKGTYFISWNVAFDGSACQPTVDFSLLVNGQSHSLSAFPVTVGQLSGFSLVTVSDLPAAVKLVNSTADKVKFGRVQVVANLLIMRAVCRSS